MAEVFPTTYIYETCFNCRVGKKKVLTRLVVRGCLVIVMRYSMCEIKGNVLTTVGWS